MNSSYSNTVLEDQAKDAEHISCLFRYSTYQNTKKKKNKRLKNERKEN